MGWEFGTLAMQNRKEKQFYLGQINISTPLSNAQDCSPYCNHFKENLLNLARWKIHIVLLLASTTLVNCMFDIIGIVKNIKHCNQVRLGMLYWS